MVLTKIQRTKSADEMRNQLLLFVLRNLSMQQSEMCYHAYVIANFLDDRSENRLVEIGHKSSSLIYVGSPLILFECGSDFWIEQDTLRKHALLEEHGICSDTKGTL